MGLFKRNIANLEIQDYVIRYVEVKNSKGTFVVSKTGEYFLPSGIVEAGKVLDKEAFAKAISYCVRKWSLRGKQVRFILPDSSVIVRKMVIPHDIEDEEVEGHLYFELGHSLHLPFDNPILDAVPINVTDSGKEVLVIAASDETVNTYDKYLKDNRTDPVVADVSSLCQYRLLHHYEMMDKEDNCLIAQFNVKSVTLSIFEENHPVFMQQFSIPYPEKTWKVIPLLNGGELSKEQFVADNVMSAFEEVYTEINRILRFYQFSLNNGAKQISKIFLSGDHLFFPELLEVMEEQFEIPIVVLAPEEIKNSGNVIDHRFYSTLGLAIKEEQ